MSYLNVWFEWEGLPPSEDAEIFYCTLRPIDRASTNEKLELVKTLVRDGVFESRSDAFYSVFEGTLVQGFVYNDGVEFIRVTEDNIDTTRQAITATWIGLKNVDN